MFKSKKQESMSYTVFTIYMVLLTWLILFKFSIHINELDHIRNINLIPFQGSAMANGHVDISEIIYNILVFVPLGVYVSIFKPDWSLLRKALPALIISLLFETLQFVFAIGASDITDLIGNTIGGLLGIAVFFLFKTVFKQKYITIINSIGLIIEITGVAMIGILIIANL